MEGKEPGGFLCEARGNPEENNRVERQQVLSEESWDGLLNLILFPLPLA